MLPLLLLLLQLLSLGSGQAEDDPIKPQDAPLPDDDHLLVQPAEPEPNMEDVYDQLTQFLDAAAAHPNMITPPQADSVVQSELYQTLDQMYGKKKRKQ